MTNDELVFYTNPMSRGRIARWMLEELGIRYRTEVVDYGTAMKAPEFLAINPMGKVPTITHAGVVVSETAAICAYLADTFPDCGLAPPPGNPARGPYLRWLFFAAGPLEAAITDKSLGVTVPPEKRGSVGYGSFDAVIDAAETAVKGVHYLAGDRFSAADLYFGSHLIWGMQFKSIEPRPAFQTYAARLRERPAYLRAGEIDNALIPAQA
jgi:glutathione S-transferase